jgi:hypothetical protein
MNYERALKHPHAIRSLAELALDAEGELVRP